MTHWEKEMTYDGRMRSGRIAKSLYRYIPNRLLVAVNDTAIDPDGYWIYLNEGWTSYDGGEDCGIIHEFTVADLKNAIKTIRKGSR